MSNQASFGKYQLVAELGHGGMADVYLAVIHGPEGLGFSKLVVVKKLRPNLAEDPDFIAMLIDEARIAARLNHPNTIQTHEIGEFDQQYFIAMEYLDGQPLHRIQARAQRLEKPTPLNFTLSIYADVLTGLHHAHELRDYDGTPLHIVHRDVTPHNIFLTYDGQVKVVDFGIAKAAGRASQTQQGIIKGKIVYMAPEQASAQDIDRRADIYCVGIMLWEALTGARMWANLDEIAIMGRLITRDTVRSAKAVNPDIPDELEAIVMKALAPNPSERYATAEDMATDLLAYLNSIGQRPVQRDIGNYIGELFEDRRREAKAVIEEQLAQLKDSKPNFNLVGIPTADATSSTSETRAGDAIGDVPATAIATALAHVPQRRSQTGWIAAASLGLVAASAGIGLFVMSARNKAPPANAATVTTATSATASGSEASGMVQIRLLSKTPGVGYSIDGTSPVRKPVYEAPWPRDNRPHLIEAVADGYETESFSVPFTSDVTREFDLRKTTLTPPKTGSGPKFVGKGPKPVDAPPVATTTTAPPVSTGSSIRPLDGTDSVFGTKSAVTPK